MPRRCFAVLFLAVTGALAGCTGSKTQVDGTFGTTETGTPSTSEPTTITAAPVPTGDPATIPLAGACALDQTFGTFTVEALDYYSSIDGAVANAVLPITVLEPIGTFGACALLKRNNPFCDPPCGAGLTCDLSEVCVPTPVNQDLGTVTIGGLLADVVMHPVPPSNTYFATQLPHPVFAPDALVEAMTHGNTFGEDLVLHGVGVEPLALGPNRSWQMVRDQSLDVSWVPSASALGRSTVEVRMSVDQHGLTPVTLVCEVPDTGAAQIDTSLINQLMDLGVTGFPSATVTRHTVDSVSLEGGCVQLEVRSEAIPQLSVDGYTPCDGPEDCPTGQTCDTVVGLCG